MAYTRRSNERGTWFQEQTNLINSASAAELADLNDNFDAKFQTIADTLKDSYTGVNIRKDAKRMMDNPQLMQEYKSMMLEGVNESLELMMEQTTSTVERDHLKALKQQLNDDWDEQEKSFVIQESYNTSTYLPLSTLDFPALVKQFVRFLGKDIIPVQTANSINIEQRIFTKYLVNNQTGEEYETPAIYFQKDEDGKPLWKKIFNAGKGYRYNSNVPITLNEIKNAPNKKLDLLQAKYLLDENEQMPTNFVRNVRTRMSYDFNILFVDVNGKKVKLPGGGIQIDIQNGGVFVNGGITEDTPLPVVDPTTNVPTGETITFSDRLSGYVDFVKGTITASSCGEITAIYVNGYISNETNLRNIGFREYPEIRKFRIGDGCRFQLPFTVEDFTESSKSLDFSIYNRMVQQLVVNQEMFEDQSILDHLYEDFDMNDGVDTNPFAMESYTHTEYVDLDPTALSPTFSGDPFEYRTNAIHNAINSTIYELCDRGKLENLGFVIWCNPKAARLIKPFTTWTAVKSTEIGGVQMNHAFGVLTDTDIPIRIVSSNRVDAYITIPAYQDGSSEGDLSREYFYNIVACPMDKFHITYKHLRFARHLTNSPENAAYADANNPGGAAVIVNSTSQYDTIHIQGIQGRVICKNTALVPDIKAGLVPATSITP